MAEWERFIAPETLAWVAMWPSRFFLLHLPLVYLNAAIGSGARRELIWVERDGREKHVGFADGTPNWPRLSPDGARAAFLVRTTCG